MAGKIGVLALQGAFIEHEKALKRCGAQTLQARTEDDLLNIDGLIIPGGESTTIGKLIIKHGLDNTIINRANQGMPIWGTCAGMILLAKEIEGSDQFRLNLMDISVKRNAFGRQIESFESELEIDEIGITKGVFIRAPYVEKVWGNAKVLSIFNNKIVMAKQENLLSTAFHPELTNELDIHQYFLKMV